MPRYFFNVHSIISPTADRVGEEFPNDEAAWHEATRFAGDLFKDIDGRLKPGNNWAIEVTDESNRILYQIAISTKAMT